MKLSNTYKILLLMAIVLAVYFPAISGQINSIDDSHIIESYGINSTRSLTDILLPAGHFYYRPIIELTYFSDNLLWGLDPGFMHLENVLVHLLNVILVYFVAVQVSAIAGGPVALPFVSALLFALHPVNTEAVSWIAGRTDPVAATFILGSLLLLLKGVRTVRPVTVAASAVCLVPALLVKETAGMLVPVSLLVLLADWHAGDPLAPRRTCFRKRLIVIYASVLAVIIICAGLVFLMTTREGETAFTMVMSKAYNPFDFMLFGLKAVGFYLKKFVLPTPLNFAIHTVSPLYLPLGGVIVLICAYLATRRDMFAAFVLGGMLFLVPAIVAAVAGVNWTPFAERYLYIPTAFLSIGMSGFMLRTATRLRMERQLYVGLALVLMLFAGTTVTRNFIWRSNLALYSDTVRKSPDFGDVYNELGTALLKSGQIKEATDSFVRAEKLSERKAIQDCARMNLLGIASQGRNAIERRLLIKDFISGRDYVHPQMYKMLNKVDREILNTTITDIQRKNIVAEMVGINTILYKDTNDPLYLYNNGQLFLEIGDRSAALDFFRRAASSAPDNAYYLDSARKLVKNLGQQ